MRFPAVRSILLSICIVAGGTSIAQATLIPLDSRFGPNTIIRDPEAGLDWLAPTATQGNPTPLDIPEAFEPGGRLAGFRFPSRAEFNEVTRFFTPVPPRLNDICGTCDFDKTLEFIRLFNAGEPRTSLRSWLSVEVLNPDPENPLFVAVGMNIFTTAELRLVEFDSQRVESSQLSPDIGYLLVRPSRVPEPAAATVLMTGLVALCLLRRGRRLSGCVRIA